MKLSISLCVFLVAARTVAVADLGKKLNYFETLHDSDLQIVSRSKRSVNGGFTQIKHISFRTLGRNFQLILTAGSPVLSPTFKAKTVAADGKTEEFFVDPNNFFTGYLADDSSATVNAHLEDGTLYSEIRCQDETYVVEPAFRHRPPSENYTMISYRGSDVNWEDILPIDPVTGKRTKLKDGIRLDQVMPDQMPTSAPNNITAGHGRDKRQAVIKNICPLLVIADHFFFRDMGNKKRQTTAQFLISTIQTVTQRFLSTVWDEENGYFNMGFHIQDMEIHTEFTSSPTDHYNYDKDWDYNDKLYALSYSKRNHDFCLVHLFTSYSFQENVLGLAFIAPESVASAGGICSVSAQGKGNRIFPRTGWSSAKNMRGTALLTLQYQLVTIHELGHNWGAEHDSDNKECAPSSQNNGKYVMWQYSVPGYESNNKLFSPCSIRYITPVLKSKSRLCFIESAMTKTMCGNSIIEEGEECDVGFLEVGEEDSCCTKECKFKGKAVCSDLNQPCCKNCNFAPTTQVCEERNNFTCLQESKCSGNSTECGRTEFLPDNTPCIDQGVCLGGKCKGFCDVIGVKINKTLKACLCSQNTTAMCRRCCAEVNGNVSLECFPTMDLLPEGRTCDRGFCDAAGHCVQVEQDLGNRIFDFITKLDVNSLVEFMKDNIVSSVLTLSIIVWIPSSCVITLVDKRKMKKERDFIKRYIARENSLMGRQEELSSFRIRNSRFKRMPHGEDHARTSLARCDEETLM